MRVCKTTAEVYSSQRQSRVCPAATRQLQAWFVRELETSWERSDWSSFHLILSVFKKTPIFTVNSLKEDTATQRLIPNCTNSSSRKILIEGEIRNRAKGNLDPRAGKAGIQGSVPRRTCARENKIVLWRETPPEHGAMTSCVNWCTGNRIMMNFSTKHRGF